jgi:hypothetical protein
MGMVLTSGENAIDPLTGLTVILGQVLKTEDGRIWSTMVTGEPRHGRNELPGTDLNFPAPANTFTQSGVLFTESGQVGTAQSGSIVVVEGSTTQTLIGVPYGFTEVPYTGPLVII